MSEFAYFRFLSKGLLNDEEKQNKPDVVQATEEALDVKGLECDNKISQLSVEKLTEVRDEMRKIREEKRRKKKQEQGEAEESEEESKEEEGTKEEGQGQKEQEVAVTTR